MLIVTMFGPPGSGKGAMSKKISHFYGIPHLSTGDMLRAEMAAETTLGLSIKDGMDAGKFVSDKMVNDLVVATISRDECSDGFVLDGYPRTMEQVQFFNRYIRKKYQSPEMYQIALAASLDVIKARVTDRFKEHGRPDDAEEIWVGRVNTYIDVTYPIVWAYEGLGLLDWVSSEQSIDDTFEDIKKKIDGELDE